jgi:hypothetical protein
LPTEARRVLVSVDTAGKSRVDEQVVKESISVDDRGLPVFADNLLWGADNGTTVIGSGGDTDAALEPLT